ncbi:Gfo/Idh/MocA family protein [Streptomyces iranensis]|uniref:Dehydrogenase n=1 Tax=Streptomyces iranensis TaxID=576784 RepID=A0A061A0W1_9ACTN|nr:hypothetical protein [Streptomyces iranensis]MBP2059842.1 putative dehydrogenase [Streptomyces iranensis]CDR14758.1 oxidoreductase domain protein [Streptomyces iranensis]
MGEPLRIGLVGAGKISRACLDTLPRLPGLRLTAVTDLNRARAEAAAKAAEAAIETAAEAAAKAADPEFYYRPGGGPLLDMGPYYLSAPVHLLGPVVRVTGAASRPRAQRSVGSGPRAGERFAVEVDTHVTGVLEHRGGALTTLLMSFDVHAARLPRIEVHGSECSLSVPDPNTFDGPVELWRDGAWEPLAPSAGYAGSARGYGLADMARALGAGRPHRASAELARHVLDVMLTLLDAARERTSLPVGTTCSRPEPVPLVGEPSASAGHG